MAGFFGRPSTDEVDGRLWPDRTGPDRGTSRVRELTNTGWLVAAFSLRQPLVFVECDVWGKRRRRCRCNALSAHDSVRIDAHQQITGQTWTTKRTGQKKANKKSKENGTVFGKRNKEMEQQACSKIAFEPRERNMNRKCSRCYCSCWSQLKGADRKAPRTSTVLDSV